MRSMQKNRSFLLYLFLTLFAVLVGGSTGYIIFSLWDLPEVAMLEEYKPSITSRVYSDNNKLLAEFFLQNRTPVVFTDVPDMLIKALIATEDTRFYGHLGLDMRGIARALYRNIRARKVVEGGSTLTQQLAKMLFLRPEKTMERKILEAMMAVQLERRHECGDDGVYACVRALLTAEAVAVAAVAVAVRADRGPDREDQQCRYQSNGRAQCHHNQCTTSSQPAARAG